jgi:hypothetical protein
MGPSGVAQDRLSAHPPDARRLLGAHLDTLRRLPVSFAPSLVREIASYDWKFPAERAAIEAELNVLSALSSEARRQWFQEFAAIRLSPDLERVDWLGEPAQFVETLSAYLWTTGQMDAFRAAAIHYAERLRSAAPPQPPAVSRLLITVIGRDVGEAPMPLFRKLRPHGVFFSHVDSANGLKILLDAVRARAKAHPIPYAHWYIDGGSASAHDPALTCVSYSALAPIRAAVLREMEARIRSGNMGPEGLRSILAQLRPADLGIAPERDPVLERFQVSIVTEGSGTQIFSTTFAQWTTREALRRAQPLTLLVRFAPRQREKTMNELLSAGETEPQLDPVGSLVDADMAAYYNWINLQRLPGDERSSMLVWFEDHGEALAVAPSLPRGTESSQRATIADLLAWMGHAREPMTGSPSSIL